MRRKDQPRRPKAIICCRLSSLNTLLMPLQASLPRSAVNVPRDYFSMAGFEVTIYGRFWVTPEVLIVAPYNAQVALIAKRLPTARVGTVDKIGRASCRER